MTYTLLQSRIFYKLQKVYIDVYFKIVTKYVLTVSHAYIFVVFNQCNSLH